MSAQTGTPSFVPSSRSAGFFKRVQNRILQWVSMPNPVWIRELRQSARITVTPFVLMFLTVAIGLIQCTLGGILSATASAVTTGIVLYHTFFSVAFFVVTLLGSALAANAVASEREGRTWEAILLTGLSPKAIARGKFFSALTSIGMYIVMLAPLGALSLLFGGITILDIVLAFVYLVAFAVLGVAMGLAISSAFSSGRVALLLTLLLTFALASVMFILAGPGLSTIAHRIWPRVLEGPPVWLPTAYSRAAFSMRYVTLLMVAPTVIIIIPTWFFFEIAVANIQSITDDRASGLKRWLIVTGPVITLLALMTQRVIKARQDLSLYTILILSALFLFWTTILLVFHAEAIGPSRRVLTHWDRAQAGKITRFLGPSMVRSMKLIAVLAVCSLTLVALMGIGLIVRDTTLTATHRTISIKWIVAVVSALIGLLILLIGVAAWSRTTGRSVGLARILVLGILFIILVGPWLAVLIARWVFNITTYHLFLGAPSPLFAYLTSDKIPHHQRTMAMVACGAFAIGYTLIGLILLGRAHVLSKRLKEKQAQYWLTVQQQLATEEQQ